MISRQGLCRLSSVPAALAACLVTLLIAAPSSEAGSISGTVWNDLDDNGVRDGGEPELQGWTVFLETDENGDYCRGTADKRGWTRMRRCSSESGLPGIRPRTPRGS